jgi:hypothetical protein
MRDDVTFGEASEPENRQPARMVVPPRALNYIEITLTSQLAGVHASVPNPPFIDGESGDIEGDDYDGMSLRTALDLRNLLLLDAVESFRRQIVIARELGPIRADGGPFTHEYEIVCALEGVEPWPLGDRLVHEPAHTEKTK